jgi:hypothetical protein
LSLKLEQGHIFLYPHTSLFLLSISLHDLINRLLDSQLAADDCVVFIEGEP